MCSLYSLLATKYDHPEPMSGSLIPRRFNLRRKFASIARKYEYNHLESALDVAREMLRWKRTVCPQGLHSNPGEDCDLGGDMPDTLMQMYRPERKPSPL